MFKAVSASELVLGSTSHDWIRHRVVLALVAVIALVACGGSQAPAASQALAPASLSVVVPSPSAAVLELYVAQARGLFSRQKLTVDISNVGAVAYTSMLVAGQADVLFGATSVPITLTLKGKPVVAIFSTSTSLPSASPGMEDLLAGPDIHNLDELQAHAGCRIAATPPGSAQYGYAFYWKSKLGLKCDIVPVQSIPLEIAGVQSGAYQATVLAAVDLNNAPSSFNKLIDASAPGYQQNYAIPYAATPAVFAGLPQNLQSKKDAVIRFCKALVQAFALINKSTLDDLVTDLQNAADWFKVQSPSTLRAQLPTIVATKKVDNPGYIAKSLWESSLQYYSYFGLQGFDPKSPAITYDKAVDMSYLAAAKK